MNVHFLNNYKLKGVALLLAVLSWGIVKQITNNDKEVKSVPISIVLPEGWAIREQQVTEVQVNFRGTVDDLLLLDKNNIQVLIDLRETEFEQEKEITIRPRQIAYTGRSARITSVFPESFRIRLGMEGQKQLPVLVSRVGEPPEGIKLEATETTPKLVTLYGEQDLLESVNSLQTAPLQLSDRIQSFEQRLEVMLPNDEWVGRIDPPRVQVKVTLAGLTEKRKFEGIPLLLYSAPGTTPIQPLLAQPDTVDVHLNASPQLLDDLKPEEIKAFVAAGANRNAEVKVLVPDGIEVLAVQPESVRLTPAPTPTPSPTPAPTETPTPSPAEESPAP